MSGHRGAVKGWAGAVCAAAAVLAGLTHTIRAMFVSALAVFCIGFVLLIAAGLPDVIGWIAELTRPYRWRRRHTNRPLTGPWRYTSDGFAAASASNTLNKGSAHPGYNESTGDPPTIRIAVLVACDPPPDTVTATAWRHGIHDLLTGAPVSDLVKSTTHDEPGLAWHPYGNNGLSNNGYVLASSPKGVTAPAVSLWVNLPTASALSAPSPRYAEVVFRIQPRNGTTNEPAPPTDMATWRDRLNLALQVPEAFAACIRRFANTNTYNDPPPIVAIRLDAPISLAQLVVASGGVPIFGSSTQRQTSAYFVADPTTTSDPILATLRAWHDHALHLEQYDGPLHEQLATIRPGPRTG